MGAERRITSRLTRYWEQKRGARPFPSESDIDPDDISDFWDHCYLMHTRDISTSDGNYMYLGKAIMRAYQGHLDPDHNPAVLSPNHRALEQHFNAVLESKTPIYQEGEFHNADGALVLYRQCMLPLGEKDDRVDGILGCMSFKLKP